MARVMPKPLQVSMIENYIAEHTDIDPAMVDVTAVVDPTLHYGENWNQIKEMLGIKTTKEMEEELEEQAERNRDPERMEVSLSEDLERTFPGVAADVEITAGGVTLTLEPFNLELAPGRGMPVVSGRTHQYPSPLKEELADKYFKSFTDESIEKAAEEEDIDLEKARELAEKVEEVEALEEVEAARAEAEEASEQAEFLRSTLESKEEEIGDFQEKIDWLNEQRLAPERVDELEGEMSGLRETVDNLRKQVNEIELKSKGFGYGKPAEPEKIEEVRTDIDRVEETVLDLTNRIDRMESGLAETLQKITDRIEKARERTGKAEIENLPEPPEVLKKFVKKYPEMEETPKFLPSYAEVPMMQHDTYGEFLEFVKGRGIVGPVKASWEEFFQYLYQKANLGPEDVEELTPKILFGHFKSYIDYIQKGQKVKEVMPLTVQEEALKDWVFEQVEEQNPELDKKKVWRSARQVVDVGQSYEENKEDIIEKITIFKGIEFPEHEERKREERETEKEVVKDFVKVNIREKTEADPETWWNGAKVHYSPAKTMKENREKMKDLMEKEFGIKDFTHIEE